MGFSYLARNNRCRRNSAGQHRREVGESDRRLSGVFPLCGRIRGGNCMPRTAWKADPTTDNAARDVLAAYDAAVKRGKPPVECYRAAVDVRGENVSRRIVS